MTAAQQQLFKDLANAKAVFQMRAIQHIIVNGERAGEPYRVSGKEENGLNATDKEQRTKG